MDALVRSAAPDFDALRRYYSPTLMPPHTSSDDFDPQYVDRLQCEWLMYNDSPTIPDMIKFHATTVCDNLRAVPRDTDKRFVHVDHYECISQPTSNYVTMPYLHHNVRNGSYFGPLSRTKHPFQYLICKCMNQRCQKRLYDSCAIRAMKKDTTLQRRFQEIMLVGLLGNFPGVQVSKRPSVQVRVRLYDVFRDRWHVYIPWFFSLVEHCSVFFMFAIRHYLCFAIQNAPGFACHMEQMTQTSKFAAIVDEAFVHLRAYFDAHLCEPSSSLYASLQCMETMSTAEFSQLPRTHYAHRWTREVATLLSVYEQAVNKITYRRGPGPMFKFIDSCRNAFPLVVMPALAEQLRVQAEQLQQQQALAQMLGKMKQVDPMIKQQVESKSSSRHTTLEVYNYVTKAQFAMLQDMMNSSSDMSCDTFQFDWLLSLGCSKPAVKALKLFHAVFELGQLSADLLKANLDKLRAVFPHAYNLLQLLAELERDRNRMRHISTLPLHYLVNQVEAIQARFNTKEYGVLVQSGLCMVYCDVCGVDYSLRRQFNSPYKQNYKEGYRDVLVDYTTGLKYCSNRKSNHRGTCGAKPLLEMSLLGKCVEFNGKTILLCPQMGCGKPMVLERSDTERREKLSKKTKNNRNKIQAMEPEVTVQEEVAALHGEMQINIRTTLKALRAAKNQQVTTKQKEAVKAELEVITRATDDPLYAPPATRIDTTSYDPFIEKLEALLVEHNAVPLSTLELNVNNIEHIHTAIVIAATLRKERQSWKVHDKKLKTRCMYNKRGIACSECTIKLEGNEAQIQELRLQFAHLEADPPRCTLCDCQFSSIADMYYYPFELYLCRRDNTMGMKHAMQEYVTEQKDQLTRAGLLERMIKHKREYSRYAARNTQSQAAKRTLAASRAKTSQGNKR